MIPLYLNINRGYKTQAIKSLLCLFILFLFLPSNTLQAQSDTLSATDISKMSIQDLMSIHVITASKKTETLEETPAVVNVISSEEIRALNFNSLEEILEYSVGLSSITAEGNMFTTTTIRGNSVTNYNVNTLLLFNNAPIYNPYHGSFHLATIPLSSIERIEIVKGSNSVLYGTNAINAVINIIPKTAANKSSQPVSTRIKFGPYKTALFSLATVKKSQASESFC